MVTKSYFSVAFGNDCRITNFSTINLIDPLNHTDLIKIANAYLADAEGAAGSNAIEAFIALLKSLPAETAPDALIFDLADKVTEPWD